MIYDEFTLTECASVERSQGPLVDQTDGLILMRTAYRSIGLHQPLQCRERVLLWGGLSLSLYGR